MKTRRILRAARLARRLPLRSLLAIAAREVISPRELAAGIRKTAQSMRKER